MHQYKELADLIYRHSPMGRGHSEHLAEVLLDHGYPTKRSEWRDIAKEKPTESGKYIVCNKSGAVFQAKYYVYPTGDGGHWGLRDKGSHITHWMPLPESVKGADNEQREAD